MLIVKNMVKILVGILNKFNKVKVKYFIFAFNANNRLKSNKYGQCFQKNEF